MVVSKRLIDRLSKIKKLSKTDIIDKRTYWINIFRILLGMKEKNFKTTIDELLSLFSKQEYNRVIEIYELNSHKIVIQKAHLIAGKTYSKLGSFTLSSQCYEKYFETINKFDEPKIHYEYGVALLRSKFYDRAIEELEPFLSVNDKFCPTPLIRALAANNRLTEAITKN